MQRQCWCQYHSFLYQLPKSRRQNFHLQIFKKMLNPCYITLRIHRLEGKLCRSRWGGSLWATSSRSTLFANSAIFCLWYLKSYGAPQARLKKMFNLQTAQSWRFYTVCPVVFKFSVRFADVNFVVCCFGTLTLKVLLTTAADYIHKYFFIVFQRK